MSDREQDKRRFRGAHAGRRVTVSMDSVTPRQFDDGRPSISRLPITAFLENGEIAIGDGHHNIIAQKQQEKNTLL